MFIGRDGEIWTHDLSHPKRSWSVFISCQKCSKHLRINDLHSFADSLKLALIGNGATNLQPTYHRPSHPISVEDSIQQARFNLIKYPYFALSSTAYFWRS